MRFGRYLIVVVLLSVAGTVVQAEAPPALSMGVFKRLMVVERLMSEEKFADAQQSLNDIIDDVEDLSAVDQAYSFHMQALIFLYQEQYRLARQHFFKSYRLQQSLNEKTRIQVIEILANLAMHEEDYEEAIRFSLEYLAVVETPSKPVYLTLASAYYQTNQFRKAISPLQQVIAHFEPDRAAYSTLFAVYYELRQLGDAIVVLEKMIRYWPDKPDYWLQLASLYLEQEQYDKSLEIMQLAYSQRFLLSENELLQYVYVLYEKDLPHKAAMILQQAINQVAIKPTYKSYELLAHLNMEACEEDDAISAYLKTAEMSDSGKEDLYLAQLYFDREQYHNAVSHAQKALDKGVRLPGNAYMLMAAAYQESDSQQETIINLKRAVNFNETRETARQWLNSISVN